MNTIEVDFDVYKALTLRRENEEVSFNDVLRDLLKLGAKPKSAYSGAAGDWVTKGVHFPAGTEFRATYKGKEHTGRVEGGALIVDGKRFGSPSAAAVAITKNPVNGWSFWECRYPGRSSWALITSLRK